MSSLISRAPHAQKSSLRLAAVTLSALALSTACKKNDGEAAGGGYVQGQVGATNGGAGAMPPAAAGASGAPTAPPLGAGGAPAAPPPAAAGAPATLPTQNGPIAQRLDASATAAVQPILTALLKDNVQAGAKPVGETLVGNFNTGQTLDIPVQLQPNKCYTVVATGLPPVTEVNVQLLLTTPIPGMLPVLAVDQEQGPTAVLGKKANCYRWMFGVIPAPGKVTVTVAAGKGLVAAQVYEK